jgi:coproporphyrinogen III oxidase
MRQRCPISHCGRCAGNTALTSVLLQYLEIGNNNNENNNKNKNKNKNKYRRGSLASHDLFYAEAMHFGGRVPLRSDGGHAPFVS